MKIKLKIPGVPVAKERPRFARLKNAGGIRPYKSKAQESAEREFISVVKHQLRQSGHDTPIPAGIALKVSCWFVMPIPASSPKKFKVQCASRIVYHTKKPDTDNLVKFAKDALNKVAWHDDSQVSVVRGMKIYGERPCTVIEIEVLGEATAA